MKQLLLVCALLALTSDASGQTTLGPVDGAQLKPADLARVKVGDQAPDFTLEDQDGKPITLSRYRGQRAVVLVFYRGYW